MQRFTDSTRQVARRFVPLESGTVIRVSNDEPRAFTIEGLLGHGGMGAVYRARREDGSELALKILHERFRDAPAVARRFAREARLTNLVDHPQVVGVIDAGVADDGAPFLVSELLEGETFEARARAAGGALPLDEVLRCADALLDVLATAHARGIVHRDIKPGNLFRLNEGELRVLDFGLAQADPDGAQEAESQLTGASTVLGTAGFMAPELALGRWDLVDGQSDLWAVAATVLFLATGKHVHTAYTSQERHALAATRPAASMAERAPELPRGLSAWLDQGLAFSKRDRFESARKMRAALATLDRGSPAAVRRTARAALLGGLALVATAGGAIGLTFVERSGGVVLASPAASGLPEGDLAVAFSGHLQPREPARAAVTADAALPRARANERPALVHAPPLSSSSPAAKVAPPSAAPSSDPLDRRR